MKTIHKQQLVIDSTQLLYAPVDIKPLTIQWQRDIPCLWYELDPNAVKVSHILHIVGTGHMVPEVANLEYIASIQDSGLVWHFYLERAA